MSGQGWSRKFWAPQEVAWEPDHVSVRDGRGPERVQQEAQPHPDLFRRPAGFSAPSGASASDGPFDWKVPARDTYVRKLGDRAWAAACSDCWMWGRVRTTWPEALRDANDHVATRHGDLA